MLQDCSSIFCFEDYLIVILSVTLPLLFKGSQEGLSFFFSSFTKKQTPASFWKQGCLKTFKILFMPGQLGRQNSAA
jgi:hypothetical protein